MNGNSKKRMFIFLSNAGGVGKTHCVEVFTTIARYAGLLVQVADWDAGNRGYRNRNGNESCVSLQWNARGSVAASEWFAQTFAEVDVAILDLGANFMSVDIAANSLGEMVDQAVKGGFEIVFMPVESPDKPGARGLVEQIYTRFSENFRVIVVRNDNRGSGAFASPIRHIDPPTLTLPYLSAGYESVRVRTERPLDQVLEHPEPEYAMASAAMAKRLLRITQAPVMKELFGDGMRARLEQLARRAPAVLTMTVSTPVQATDRKLRMNEEIYLTRMAMFKAADSDPDACCEAIRAYKAAINSYQGS